VTFVGVAALLDAAVVAGLILRNFSMFHSVVGTWLPYGLIYLATWVVGTLRTTMPHPPLAGAR
jgi:hypothetical protein